ncbi:helicase associated domain-containing protein [Streptomyces virginiae]
MWGTAHAGFATNLGPTRAYYELRGSLAAPRGATILDIAIGQWLTDVRRPGGLGKDPGSAASRTCGAAGAAAVR